jgi:prepilin-type N-terminal cleavage/methylation domain-containing protein
MGRHRTKTGFTLVEAMIAMTILAIAALGIILPFSNGASSQAEGAHRAIAGKLASDLVEKIGTTTYANIVSTWNSYSETMGQVKDSAGSVFADPLYSKFSRSATASVTTLGATSVTWVTVTVNYNGHKILHVKSMIGKPS